MTGWDREAEWDDGGDFAPTGFDFSRPITAASTSPGIVAAARPTVHLGDDQLVVIGALARALVGTDGVYAGEDGQLVEVLRGAGREMTLQPITVARARKLLHGAVRVLAGQEGVGNPVPGRLANDLLATVIAEAALAEAPRITRISPWPFFAPGGRLVSDRGYDPETGVYVAGGAKISVPEHPTRADAEAAVGRLRDLTRDFPWRDDSGFAGWLASALTLLARPATGLAPLMLFTGTGSGEGKTTLAELAHVALTGESAPRSLGKTGRQSDGEIEKALVSAAVAGRAMTLVDNLRENCELVGDAWAAVTTGERVQARRLGHNDREIFTTFVTVWVATGNRVRPGEDMRRRTVTIPLEWSGTGDARTRAFDRDIYAEARQCGDRIATDLATILAAWWEAGEPAYTGHVILGFGEWCRIIGGALEYAGVPGFLSGWREQMLAPDDADAVWIEHFEWLAAAYGSQQFTARQVYEERFDHEELDAGSYPYPPGIGETSVNVPWRLSKAYGGVVGKRISGWKLVDAGKTHGGKRGFCVIPPEPEEGAAA